MTDDRHVASGWVPILFAVLANAWVLAMPFQADDYLILPNVGAALGIEHPAPPDDQRADAAIGNFFLFRPVPWFIWWALIRGTGIVAGVRALADPLVFHAAALLFHALSSFLLWRVLGRICHPRAAQIGAVLFAIAPGGVQATSYAAAGGDQLAVLFMLGATSLLQSWRIRPSALALCGGTLAAAAAFCSKDVAVASIPAGFLAVWATPSTASRRRLWRPAVAVAFAIFAAYAVRSTYLGTWRPVYLSPVRLGFSDLGKLDELFLVWLTPWRTFVEVADLAPFAARLIGRVLRDEQALSLLAALAFGLPLAAGLLVRPARTAARLVPLGVALAIVLSPALTIYDRTYEQVISRALYPAGAVACAAVAVGCDALCGGRRRRVAAVVLVAPLAFLFSDFMTHVARTELRAGSVVDARIDSMRDLAARSPPGARIVAVDDMFALGAIPTIYFGIGPAMKAPFSRTAARVMWWDDLATLPRSPVLRDADEPVVIAWISEGRYAVREPVIPAIPPGPIVARRTDPSRAEWRFEGGVPARAVAGILLAPGRGKAAGVVTCTWVGSRCRRETRAAFPGLAGGDRAYATPPDEFDWLADPAILSVSFSTDAVESVEALRRLPEVRIVAPAAGAVLPAAAIPDVAFELPDQPPSEAYRLTIEFAISERDRPLMVSEAPAHVLRQGSGPNLRVYEISRQRSNTIASSPPADARTLSLRLDDALRRTGSRMLPFSLMVEGIDPRSGAVECRSRWRNGFLKRSD